jgi:hypothetical protein
MTHRHSDTFRRILPPVATVALAVALAACNARNNAPMDDARAPSSTNPSATTTPAPMTTPSQTTAQGSTSEMGNDASDAMLTTKVKAALLADPSIKSLDVKVETVKGGVQLSGFVNDQKQIDQAALLARGVSGVTSVDNKLVLKP